MNFVGDIQKAEEKAKAKEVAEQTKAGEEGAKVAEAGGLEQGREEAKVAEQTKAGEAGAKVAEAGGLEQGREEAKEEAKVAAEPVAKELAGSASDEKGATTIESQENKEENKRIIEGSLIAAVATMSAATKIAESKDDKNTVPTTVTTTDQTTVPTKVPSTVLESKGEEKDTLAQGAVSQGKGLGAQGQGLVEQGQGLVEQGQGLVSQLIGSAVPGTVKGATPVKPPVQDTRIKSLFLDNLHLFFGDIHLKPIKEFINPSHQLNQHLDMSTMNGLDRENYEHGRLLTLLKNMFFRESEGVISKERVFKGGGITIDQLKNKIKKGISLIVPKS